MHPRHMLHHCLDVKDDNIDSKMIKKAFDGANLEIVDFRTKKLAYHFSLHVVHSQFCVNLVYKKTLPTGKLLSRIEKLWKSGQT